MIFAILVAAAPVTGPGTIPVTGIGLTSCSVAVTQDKYLLSAQWVWGYFAGLNAAGEGPAGSSTAGVEIMANLRKVCASDPSLRLINAAAVVYKRLAAEKR